MKRNDGEVVLLRQMMQRVREALSGCSLVQMEKLWWAADRLCEIRIAGALGILIMVTAEVCEADHIEMYGLSRACTSGCLAHHRISQEDGECTRTNLGM